MVFYNIYLRGLIDCAQCAPSIWYVLAPMAVGAAMLMPVFILAWNARRNK